MFPKVLCQLLIHKTACTHSKYIENVQHPRKTYISDDVKNTER